MNAPNRNNKVMLATMLGALLAKHGIIPKCVVTNAREHPLVMDQILGVVGDMIQFIEFSDADTADTSASAVIIGGGEAVSRHTPGPWKLCNRGDYTDYEGESAVITGNGDSVRIAVVHHAGTAEDQANANLIAAAPDLLAALNKMLQITNRDHVFWYGARNAIAKAEGRKP